MTDVLTVTLNPALDVATSTTVLMAAHKLRCGPGTRFAGGGGINVARVLHRLGAETRALYLGGGANGEQLAQLLDAEGVPAQCLPISGETRENFSVTETSTGREYRFVLPGPTVLAHEWDTCRMALDVLRPVPAWLVLSGSLPPGLAPDALAQLATAAAQRGSRVVIDSSGAALAAAMQTQDVYLVKPSLRELSELCGHALETEPQWRADGLELYYVTSSWRLAAVQIGRGGSLTLGRASTLFETYVDTSFGALGQEHCAPSGDGQRFLVNVLPDVPPTVVLMQHWANAAKR